MSRPTILRVPLSTGLTYNVLEWESVSNHTVVLLHGYLDTAWTWEALAAGGLAGRAHLIAPDWRGHGDSDWVGAGGSYHVFDYVADLASLVERLGRPRLSLIAHSMGATIASYFAGTYPDRVESLVLLEGLGTPDRSLDPARMAEWIAGWQAARTSGNKVYASIDEAAARLQWSDPELDDHQARRLAERALRCEADGAFRFKHDPLQTIPGPTVFSSAAAARFWAAIRCPVLLLDGATSRVRVAPDEAARREASFPHARRVVIDGTGHSPHRHRPGEVARLVLEHIFMTPESTATPESRCPQLRGIS